MPFSALVFLGWADTHNRFFANAETFIQLLASIGMRCTNHLVRSRQCYNSDSLMMMPDSQRVMFELLTSPCWLFCRCAATHCCGDIPNGRGHSNRCHISSPTKSRVSPSSKRRESQPNRSACASANNPTDWMAADMLPHVCNVNDTQS